MDFALPFRHLTARVPWHDRGWDGHVCDDPSGNLSCLALRGIANEKDPAAEDAVAGRRLDELDQKQFPACVGDRGSWLRAFHTQRVRPHPYAWRGSHSHLLPTAVDMPPYAIMATPFRWMLTSNAPDIAARWGLGYDADLELMVKEAASGSMGGWVQHHENQAVLLDAFFSAVRGDEDPAGGSLLFVYAKDLPLVDAPADDADTGGRHIVAVTTVQAVHDAQRYDEAPGGGVTGSVFWERPVVHALRRNAGSGWDGGVVLPYHQLLNDADLVVEGLTRFVAHAPADRRLEFSYGSEHLSHDGAVDALTEVARAVREAAPHVEGDWDRTLRWIDRQVARVWRARGAYPGIGSALAAAGVTNGTLAAHALTQGLSERDDPWQPVLSALNEAVEGRGPLAGRVGATEASTVINLPVGRMRLLRLLSRMDLTPDQATRLFRPEDRERTGIDLTDDELLTNPWIAYEADRGLLEPVSFRVADRATMVEPAIAAAHPLPIEPHVEGPNDLRRVRAALCDRLELAALRDGNTLLPQSLLLERVNGAYEPPLDATSDLIAAHADRLAPVVLPAPVVGAEGETAGWQLDRLRQCGDIIRAQVERRITRGTAHAITRDWRGIVDDVIERGGAADSDVASDELEELARTEKAAALEKMATNRFTALVGPAGTGKTTLIEALKQISEVADDGILLLAPTGKAVVQLRRRTALPAKTIAGFLIRSGRFHWQTGAYRPRGGNPVATVGTVVIDESSMITEPMLAAVLDALGPVKRLILAGDHRQLPPIGEGRPFADAVALARDHDDGRCLAELALVRRQSSLAGGDPTDRDDLRLAAWFASDPVGRTDPDDTLWSRLSASAREDAATDGTVTVRSWQSPDDLADLIQDEVEQLAEVVGASDANDANRLLATFGFGPDERGYFNPPDDDWANAAAGVERWQVISPVRHRPGGVAPINQLVQQMWLHSWWPRRNKGFKVAAPAGPGRVTHGDKVIVTRNKRRDAYDPKLRETVPDGLMANGEIGMIWGRLAKGGRVKERHVWLSSQEGVNFTVWDEDFSDESSPLLEAAYAITVHKAQGSQFGTVLLVLPDPCPLTSPELLYTALTRQTERVVLLIQGGDPSRLRAAYGPIASATAARLTNLFGPPVPVALEARDRLLDRRRIHLTDSGVLVRSKSELVVANALTHAEVSFEYEKPFWSADRDRDGYLLPDFTIEDDATGETILWEHLGMMDRPDYRSRWDEKVGWYRRNGVLPLAEGGGSRASLVWSDERAGMRMDQINGVIDQIR